MSEHIALKAINTIRTLSIDAIDKANSGHPGLPMGAAPMAYTLFARHLKHNPKNPKWFNRDRFVLSAGHGSMLLYSLLHLHGYGVSIEDIKAFRQLGSKTPGHPEYGHTPGVEATTGPLGQGIGMAVGMAMAERHLAAQYNQDPENPIVDHFTYVLCGDGDLMEGVALEAISLAGHLKLGKLIMLYDSNNISLDGELHLAFTEYVQKKFEASGWHYLRVEDGNNIDEIDRAIQKGKEVADQPTLIEVKTTIGYGSPNRAGTNEIHGKPLGLDENKLVKEFYAWEHEAFHVPEEVQAHYRELLQLSEQLEASWNKQFEAYKSEHRALGTQLEQAILGELPIGWEEQLPSFETGEKLATRASSGKVINALAKTVPQLFGGSADLASSNNTMINGSEAFYPPEYVGRNIWFGVREHAMGAALNGMALHGGLKVYGGTFFVFSDYLKPAIRMAALQSCPVTFVFTHDSIAVGEDGPTHEPIEQLPGLRAIPNLTVLRPADANETLAAWKIAIQHDRPTCLVLTRQGLPTFAETKDAPVHQGAYVLSDCEGDPELLLIGTGSEVSLCMDVKKRLTAEGIKVRVISMPSWDLFERQSAEYKQSVFPAHVKKRLAVELAYPLGWEKYVGDEGIIHGITTFGASGPGDVLLKEYGFSVDNLYQKAKDLLQS